MEDGLKEAIAGGTYDHSICSPSYISLWNVWIC